jgi:glucosamine kinase
MIVVTDSGSTKADWIFANSGGYEQLVRTVGVNPFLHASDHITRMVGHDLTSTAPTQEVHDVYFYGAGCSDEKRCRIMQTGLQSIFPNAIIHVEHDLLAAARAACGKEPGIACILGTGSNSCAYDGNAITDNVPSLGYLVGDEGSGCHLGKSLLKAYYYREMPSDLERAFTEEIAFDKTAVFDQIYGDKPNVYMASLSEFLTRRKEHPFAKEMASACFMEFLERHVLKYDQHKELPIHFVGSIAFLYQDIIEDVLDRIGLRCGRFIRKPIVDLVAFHLEKDQSH